MHSRNKTSWDRSIKSSGKCQVCSWGRFWFLPFMRHFADDVMWFLCVSVWPQWFIVWLKQTLSFLSNCQAVNLPTHSSFSSVGGVVVYRLMVCWWYVCRNGFPSLIILSLQVYLYTLKMATMIWMTVSILVFLVVKKHEHSMWRFNLLQICGAVFATFVEVSSFLATLFTHEKCRAVNSISGFYTMLLLAFIWTNRPCCLHLLGWWNSV